MWECRLPPRERQPSGDYRSAFDLLSGIYTNCGRGFPRINGVVPPLFLLVERTGILSSTSLSGDGANIARHPYMHRQNPCRKNDYVVFTVRAASGENPRALRIRTCNLLICYSGSLSCTCKFASPTNSSCSFLRFTIQFPTTTTPMANVASMT